MDTVFRALAIYGVLLLILRASGQRSLAQITTFDFVLLLILGESTQQALIGNDFSVTTGVLLIASLVGIDMALARVKQRSPAMERVLEGVPLVLVAEGRPLRDRMSRAHVDDEDVLEAARERQGVERMDQIEYAVLERSGGISIVPRRTAGSGPTPDRKEGASMQKPSKEATAEQLGLAREQGDAFRHALEGMKQETGHAERVRVGDYIVGYAAEEAEGLYEWRDGRLEWREPTDENVHIEVVVADAADGRFIPGLEVSVTLEDGNGRSLGPHDHPMLWHPWLFHYGRNWTVPGDGPWQLRVHVEPLKLARHDKRNGGRFAEPVDVRFDAVQFETGQKRS